MKPRKTSPAAARNNVVRAPADVLEVLDRVLDRGIVIDAWLRVSVIGLRLVDIDARVVVASFRTYVLEGDRIAGHDTVSRPAVNAAAAKRRPVRPARRRRRSRPAAASSSAAPSKIMLRCAEGCTFLRASKRSPVRCAFERTRKCGVSVVA
jgi:hypothetical protein